MTTATDPVVLEVIASSLASTADEMALQIMRSAYSPVVRDAMDYSTALCDRDGALLAQGLTLAAQLGTFPSIMSHIVSEQLPRPGDVFIANDPFDSGGQHLPDIYVIQPVFVDDHLEGYAATMAHHADVGGLTPGSVAIHAEEIFQEGLRIPLLKLVNAGRMNETVLAFLKYNTRLPTEVLGDVRAQLAACRTGADGMRRLVEKYGALELRRYFRELQNAAERAMRHGILLLPDGRYSFTDYLDGYGPSPKPIPITVEVLIAGETVHITFPNAPDQVPASLNCPVGMVYASCYCALRQVVELDLPNCEGYMRPIRLDVPVASILNPVFPAACGARGVISYRVYDALMGALAQAVPERVRAPGEGGPTLVAFGGVQDGKPFVLTEVLVGNWGAMLGQDGVDGISNPLANLSNEPVELIEANFPLEVACYELVRDSGGAGAFRGGLAFRRDYRVLTDSVRMTIRTDRRQHPPPGLFGGHAGGPSTIVINPGKPDERQLPTMPMEEVILNTGDLVHHVSAGGGGVGAPKGRSAAAVSADLLDEKVSSGAARALYGMADRVDGSVNGVHSHAAPRTGQP